MPHDATLSRLKELCAGIAPSQVGCAFLASLGSREPALRSALGSFAVARYRPDHQYSPYPTGVCRHCGLHPNPGEQWLTDLNVLNFERLKWGGVRHFDASYEVFDLEQFRQLPAREPSREDVDLFHRILASIRTLPPDAPVSQFEKSLSGVLPSNKNERRKLIEVLCLCGVLSYPGYHNFFDETVPPADRPYRNTDWGVPAMYWRARDGYNVEHLKEYFPNYAPGSSLRTVRIAAPPVLGAGRARRGS